MATKEDIKRRRLLKSGNIIQEISPQLAEDLHKFLALIQPMPCPQCKEHLPKIFFSDVRGEKLCFRCQFDRTHDYMEENRRRIDKKKR